MKQIRTLLSLALLFFAATYAHAQDKQWLIENFQSHLEGGREMQLQYRAHAAEAIMIAVEAQSDPKEIEDVLTVFSMLVGDRGSIPTCDLEPILAALSLPLSIQKLNADLHIYHYAYGEQHAYFIRNNSQKQSYRLKLVSQENSNYEAVAEIVSVCSEANAVMLTKKAYIFKLDEIKPFGTAAICPCQEEEEAP